MTGFMASLNIQEYLGAVQWSGPLVLAVQETEERMDGVLELKPRPNNTIGPPSSTTLNNSLTFITKSWFFMILSQL